MAFLLLGLAMAVAEVAADCALTSGCEVCCNGVEATLTCDLPDGQHQVQKADLACCIEGAQRCADYCPTHGASGECNPSANEMFWTNLAKVNTAIAPVGLIAQIRGRIEYESKLAEAVPKNKIILALITMLGLGFCGVDRCYMGSVCLGVIKGFTGGGLIIWALIDWFVIVVNCLSMSKDLTQVGFNSTFSSDSVKGGCIVCAVFLGIKLIGCVLKACAAKSDGRTKVAEEIPETSDYAMLAA
jgi:TM2 domain-containing membrane protein YozV